MESTYVEELERKRDVDGLIAVLSDSASAERPEAARSLGQVGDDRAVEALLQSLDDHPESFPALREAAITSLGALGDSRATQPLLQVLDDVRTRRRAGHGFRSDLKAVYQALAKLGDERAVEPLLHALDEDRAANRADAASSSVVVMGVDVERLANYSVISALCEALASFKDERAVEPLIELLRGIRAEAQSEKEGWWDPGTRDRFPRWNTPPLGLPQGSLATSLIRCLGELGDERAVAAILEWEPLKRDYGKGSEGRFDIHVDKWVDQVPWPLEDACIEALRNIGGDDARNALGRFGVQVRHLP